MICLAEPWKEKNLPEAGNSPTAPAQWNDETQEWDVYKGNKEIEEKLQVIEAKLDSVINDGAVSTRLTGSNVEVIFSETDFVCPANSHKRLEDVNVADFKEFFIHFIPGGLSNYEIHYYIKRPSGSTLTRSMVEKRTSASNGMTDRFIMNSITASISVYNETDDDHVFSEIYLFGVRT